MARRIERVLTNDASLGIARHADACTTRRGISLAALE